MRALAVGALSAVLLVTTARAGGTITCSTYQGAAQQTLRAALAEDAMRPGGARPLARLANEMLLGAFALRPDSESPGVPSAKAEALAAELRQALVAGTDPSSARYFGAAASFGRDGPRLADLCFALQLARDRFWAPLSPDAQAQVARWLALERGNGIRQADRAFMHIAVLSFLDANGFAVEGDRAVITHWLDEIDFMHRGHGWFRDEISRRCDYASAYVFNYDALLWARLYGAGDPERARRWQERAADFAQDYVRLFAPDGECPAFGDGPSQWYAGVGLLALIPRSANAYLNPGTLRRLTARAAAFWREHGPAVAVMDGHGLVPPGQTWTDNEAALAFTKGFAALLLPPDDPFWAMPEAPLPSEGPEYVIVRDSAGIVIRHFGDAVELIDAGASPTSTLLPDGLGRWTKAAYRTGIGVTVVPAAAEEDWSGTNWTPDEMLLQRLDSGRMTGRYQPLPIARDVDHVVTTYDLGSAMDHTNTTVRSYLWWKAGWQLQLHHVQALQPVVLTLGGFAVPSAAADAALAAAGAEALAWTNEGRGTALQPLAGLAFSGWDRRTTDAEPRRHVLAPYHVTPLATTPRFEGERWLVALMWSGNDRAESAPWRLTQAGAGRWVLQHPVLGQWVISDAALPALGVTAAAPEGVR